MSVPVSERSDNKFEVILKARHLASYTLKVASNINIFDEKYYNAITQDIIKLGKDIYIHLWDANNCDLRTESETRLAYQKQALRECQDLLATIQLAQPIFHLKTKRIEYWGDMIIEVRNLIRAWINSDRKRIGK